jgi:hypothetical protein
VCNRNSWIHCRCCHFILHLAWGQVNNQSSVENLGFVFIAYGVISFSAMYLHERRNKDWFTLEQKQEVVELYADRWLGLWHPQDEAISALSNIRRVKFKLIKNEFLKPLIGILQLLFVTFFGGLILKDIVCNNADGLSESFYFAPETADDLVAYSESLTIDASNTTSVAPFAASIGEIVGALFSHGFYSVVFFVFLATISWVLKKAIVPIGTLLAWPLNKTILGSIRRATWGGDLVKEDVHDANHSPPAFPHKRGNLPDFVSKPLRNFSEINAIKTLENVRKVLGMTSDSSSNIDLGVDLEATLNWKELINTSYFHVPEFIDLMALGLHQTGVAKLREGFIMTPEREELAAWIAENAELTSNVDEL